LGDHAMIHDHSSICDYPRAAPLHQGKEDTARRKSAAKSIIQRWSPVPTQPQSASVSALHYR